MGEVEEKEAGVCQGMDMWVEREVTTCTLALTAVTEHSPFASQVVGQAHLHSC